MLDYQRIVEELGTALVTADDESVDGLRMAVADYGVACDEVNERLRVCGELLRKGLRGEALQKCEMEPNLLDVVAVLDFPEREQLDRELRVFGIASPAPLAIDVAGDLNEAYAQQQPLETLLRRHRLLALAHSPLKQRLQVLRQIGMLDPANPVWQDDLYTYEDARLSEIEREMRPAISRGDVATVQALSEEVGSSSWSRMPPAQLLKKLQDANNTLQANHARASLEALEPELNDAFAGFDVGRGRDLRNRWQACLASCPLDSTDPLAERAAPALEWLEQQDVRDRTDAEFATAVANLGAALDGNVPTEARSRRDEALHLERLYHAAIRFNRDLDPNLEQRYRRRLADLELADKRRYRLIVAGVVSALLIVAVGVVLLSLQMAHDRQVAEHAELLSDLLEQEQLTEAQRFIEQMQQSQPNVASDTEVQALIGQYERLQRDEDERRSAFAKALAAATAGGAEAPDRSALRRAADLAELPQEKADVSQFELEVATADRLRQEKLDQAFRSELQPLTQSVADAGKNPSPDNAAQLARVQGLQDELASFKTRHAKATPTLLMQTDVLKSRLAALEESALRRQQEMAFLSRFDAAVGNEKAFASLLESYQKDFADTRRSKDFEIAAGEITTSSSFSAWNKVANAWNRLASPRISPQQAGELIVLAESFLKDYGETPFAPQLTSNQERLRYLAARVDENGVSVLKPLEDLFGNPLVANVRMIEVMEKPDQRSRYYLGSEPIKSLTNFYDFKAYPGFDLTEKTLNRKVPADAVLFNGVAPQVELAKSVKVELQKLKQSQEVSQWDDSLAKVIQQICAAEKVDAVLRLLLLKKTVEVGSLGSEKLNTALASTRQMLENSAVNPFANWVNPIDEESRTARSQAEIEMAAITLETPDQLASALRKPANSAPQALPTYSPIGWLCRTDSGLWDCRVRNQAPLADGRMVVAVAGSDDDFSLSSVGTVQGTTVKLGIAPGTGLLEGRIVWLELVP